MAAGDRRLEKFGCPGKVSLCSELPSGDPQFGQPVGCVGCVGRVGRVLWANLLRRLGRRRGIAACGAR